ncbi:MAG: beta-ketoacyl-ACP synthase II [Treponemataceae bacterium]|nr:beta-ketoacyl-ACP synthase II [Treponemataceae bacterium]
MRKVVVTGLGAVTPCGNSIEETWNNIVAGKSGIGPVTHFDASSNVCKIAAELKNFNPGDFMDRKDSRKMGLYTQYAVASAIMAVKDAGLTKEAVAAEGDRTGVLVGNGIGGFDILEAAFKKYFEAGPSRIPPLSCPMLIPNEAPGNISMMLGIHGTAFSLATACSSGTDALGIALDQIRSGRLDMVLAGGTEATISGFGLGIFDQLQALATGFNDCPEKASRPFDKDRGGFVMGEGAAILILEEYEHAKARGAHIYCEFAGYGGSSDGYHITSPDPSGKGGALAMTKAIQDAGIDPSEVQYYNAHGTSTHINDPSETAMIKMAFGDHAKNMKVSSTKSMTGHCLGAAGAIEAAISIKAMQDGIFPPTINLDNVDVEGGCDLDYVPNKAQKSDKPITCVASGSLGFGGHNGVVVFKAI